MVLPRSLPRKHGSRLVAACIVLLFVPLLTQGAILTPSQVIKLWIQLYPADLKAAAALTTRDFRKGKDQTEWIEANNKSLGVSKFHYLGGKVISETIDGEDAVVVFQGHFVSVIGEQIEEEVYYLKKQLDGGWLIDSVEMKEDHVLGHDS